MSNGASYTIIIQLHQRERREWQRERSQLLTVIELQQRELSKRGNTVQERAAEIAREFSKSIMSFEERLVACESPSLHHERMR